MKDWSGENRIWTYVAVRRQIYSLMQLTALPSPHNCFNEQLCLLYTNIHRIGQWNYSEHYQSSNNNSYNSEQCPHLSSSSYISLCPTTSSEHFHKIRWEIYQRSTKNHNHESKHNTSEHFSKAILINAKIADNGTWTRTSRAEVCYATPTTSYPHSIFTVVINSVMIYKKIRIKIKSILHYFIYFFKKWL